MDKRENAHEGRWWASINGFTATSEDSHYDRDGNVVITADEGIPVRFEVCSVCEGRGTYVNPSIDYNGITADEMHELGEEFLRDYGNDVFLVRCRLCEGTKVVPVPTHEAHILALRATVEDMDEVNAMYEAERRMGA